MKQIYSVPIKDGVQVIMIIILPMGVGVLSLSLISFPHPPFLPPSPFLTVPCHSILLLLVSNFHFSSLSSSPLPSSPLTEGPLVCTSYDKLHESAVSPTLYRIPYTVYSPAPVLPLTSIFYHRSRDSRTSEGLLVVLHPLQVPLRLLLHLLLHLLLLEHRRR